jgi:hypothetical protein
MGSCYLNHSSNQRTPSQPLSEISINGGRARAKALEPYASGCFYRPEAVVTDFHCGAGRTPANAHCCTTIAIDQFAKGLLALSDDALIDTYHQAAEDLRATRAEGSDNLGKAHAQTLATEKAMRDRFPDYRSRYKMRYP